LSASASDSQVSLNWDDNGETDLAGYNVYRSTTEGGPYTQIATLVATSDYLDLGVVNGTTYYYVVTAVDLATPVPNESGNSNEASATPGSQPTVYVENINMSLVSAGQNTKAVAGVQISPGQSGATVVGDWYFNGEVIQTGASGITDGTGYTEFTSAPKKAKSSDVFEFVVTDVVLSGYIYDPGQGVTSGSIAVP
jgi:fibronectin type 3 domain-containing protein